MPDRSRCGRHCVLDNLVDLVPRMLDLLITLEYGLDTVIFEQPRDHRDELDLRELLLGISEDRSPREV